MPTTTVKLYHCNECRFQKILRDNETIEICPMCGNGIPDECRANGYNLYRGHVLISYRDGSTRPTRKEIDEGIRSGRLREETMETY